MTKTELVEEIVKRTGLAKKQAKAVIDALPDIIADTLKKGDSLSITGFGVFTLKERKEKTGINPLTKKKIKIPARKIPHLKFSSKYKEIFN